MSGRDRNKPCPCGSGLKAKKCCGGEPKSGLWTPSADDLLLTVETAAGTLIRGVPAAMPLRLDRPQGEAAEQATHGAASLWGLPDFFLRPKVRKVGSTTREIGDGLLIVGGLGVVLQVKSRHSVSDQVERERKWLGKNINKALRQGRGTIRRLRQAPELMVNGRDRQVLVDGNDFLWLTVVVIDHDQVPSDFIPDDDKLEGAVVLLRRDWEFLYDQLKSSFAVASYLARVAGGPIELGTEPVRYHQLANADAEAEPDPFPEQSRVRGARKIWRPKLPLEPVAHRANSAEPQRMFRLILEYISSIDAVNGMTEEVRVRALGELDRLPVQDREVVGDYLLKGLERLQPLSKGLEWRMRRVFGGLGSTQLVFGVCSGPHSEVVEGLLNAYVQLRHHEFCKRLEADASPLTVGVLLTPRVDSDMPFDTTLGAIIGPIALTEADVERLTQAWPREDHTLLAPSTIGTPVE